MMNDNRTRSDVEPMNENENYKLGQIKELQMVNFMCYKNFSIRFSPRSMQIVTGVNGSGKSTIANGICLCLGAAARTTGRTSNVQSFIRKGATFSELNLILSNEGPEAFKPEKYGKQIQIQRRIGKKNSIYQIKNENGETVSKKRETVEEIIGAFGIAPENPLCVLHQEISKHFLISSDAEKRYQFYMKVSQLDSIKQSYEQGVFTVELLSRRIDAMRKKVEEKRKEIEPLEQKIKLIEIRREKTLRKQKLENDLLFEKKNQKKTESIARQNSLGKLENEKNIFEEEIISLDNENQQIDENLRKFSAALEDLKTEQSEIHEIEKVVKKKCEESRKNLFGIERQTEIVRRKITEIELEQIDLEQKSKFFEDFQLKNIEVEEQRSSIKDQIISNRQSRNEIEQTIKLLTEQLKEIDEQIFHEKILLEEFHQRLEQIRFELQDLETNEENEKKIYGFSIAECLKLIQEENRFHKKPIGPIGRFVHCVDERWRYAVEKHLSSVMNGFICNDIDDEVLLIEIFSKLSSKNRPKIFVRTFHDKVHDVSGTLKKITEANLISVYTVLKIDESNVGRVLIDEKQIEATILVENIEEVKKLRQTGILRWKKIEKKVRRVHEALISDGTTIEIESFRQISPAEPETSDFFFSTRNKEKIFANFEEIEKKVDEETRKIRDLEIYRKNQNEIIEKNRIRRIEIDEILRKLDEQIEIFDSVDEKSSDEFSSKLEENRAKRVELVEKYDELLEENRRLAKENFQLVELQENIRRKHERKDEEKNSFELKIQEEKLKRHQIENQKRKIRQKIQKLNKLRNAINKNEIENSKIQQIETELKILKSFLEKNEDNLDERRELIEQFRQKRNEFSEFLKNFQRSARRVEKFKNFVGKRKEKFLIIADQQELLLSRNFRRFMEENGFFQCDISVDHREQKLKIFFEDRLRSVDSFSGGEKSILIICFLQALWASIFQPFRILDEIEIFMDEQNRSFTLEKLFQNSQTFSDSQHIVFTPQTIDFELWRQREVPIFQMPTPKRTFDA